MLREVVERRTRLRSMLLATMTMKNQMHGFPISVHAWLLLAALLAAKELRYNLTVLWLHMNNARKIPQRGAADVVL